MILSSGRFFVFWFVNREFWFITKKSPNRAWILAFWRFTVKVYWLLFRCQKNSFWLSDELTSISHLLSLTSALRLEADLPTCDNCSVSNSERRSGVPGESISISTFGSKRSRGWIIDVALSKRELTNEALRSDLMLLRLSQSLIIYIGLSRKCLSQWLLSVLFRFASPREGFSSSAIIYYIIRYYSRAGGREGESEMMAKDRRTVLLANIIRLDEDPFMQFASSSEVIMIITFIKPIPAVPPVAFSLFSSHNLIPLLILNNFPLCSLRSVRRLRLSLCVVSARAHLPLLSLSLSLVLLLRLYLSKNH